MSKTINGGMVVKYARLSRDDDKKKYVSIQNQNSIMDKYAADHNLKIDRSFEDDGWSGYSMDRPDFNELKHLIDENMVDILLVKDLSRLGRHNAGVLYFLERLQAHNVRLILIDDNYDSLTDSDDMLGIKTWYNELYVKDASKKVRNAIKIMQEKKEFIQNVPYGYMKDPFRKDKYYIDPDAAIWVKKIYEFYADGHGYKHIVSKLNELGAPTPSMLLDKRRKERGLKSRVRVAKLWDLKTVANMIGNDFYIGTLRLRKSVRKTINGDAMMLPEEEHIVFENAHEPIITLELFNLVESIRNKRKLNPTYKGIRKHDNPYGGMLQCGDCGRALSISNYKKEGGVLAFCCRAYRDLGPSACSSHNIQMSELNTIVLDYLSFCRAALKDIIESLDSIIYEHVRRDNGHDVRLKVLQTNIESMQKELQITMEQKIKDISNNVAMADMISKTYDNIINDKMSAIETMQTQIKEYESIDKNKGEIKRNFKSAMEVFDNIIKSGNLTKRQLESIIEKIVVYEDCSIEIKLRGELSKIFEDELVIRTSRADRIKRTAINFMTSVSSFGRVRLLNEIRKYDSLSQKDLTPLIDEFIEKGYVIKAPTKKGDRPPHICVATKEEMLKGFNICTDIGTVRSYVNLSANLDTYAKISIWISRYL